MTDLNRIVNLLPSKQPTERVLRMWYEIAAAHGRGRLPKKPRKNLIFAIAGTAAAAVVAALLLIIPASSGSAGPLVLNQGSPIPSFIASSNALVQRFSDGSSLDLESNSRLRLIESSGTEVRFELQSGRARFDIVPGGPRRWQVDCGRVVVTVLGTAFLVERDDTHVAVRVERGKVSVSGEGVKNGEQKLLAGAFFRIDSESKEELAADLADNGATPASSPVEDPAIQGDGTANPSRSNWQHHVSSGRYVEAFDEIGAERFAALVKRSRNAEELFSLADVARLSAHPTDAAAALEVIVDRFPNDAKAGLAAYTLGRLYLEQLSAPQKAIFAFEKAAALGLPDALKEALLVKKILASRLIGDPRADALATEYILRYPDGRYLDQVQP